MVQFERANYLFHIHVDPTNGESMNHIQWHVLGYIPVEKPYVSEEHPIVQKKGQERRGARNKEPRTA
jgi:hypothetical protein